MGQLVEVGSTNLWRLVDFLHLSIWPRMGRRLQPRRDDRRTPCQTAYRPEQHFGSLDDQTLNDLGLQRSEIRAAEYGILPGEQALHVAEPGSVIDDHDDPPEAQPRSRT